MIAFTKFSEDPNARHATVMIDPRRVESCSVGKSPIAHGGIMETLTITMQSGTVHVVYGDTSNYLQIERSMAITEVPDDVSGFEVADVLAKEISWHEDHPDKSLSIEYQKGFVNGLIHARQTIGSMQSAIGADELN
jgi:hypothetical protein